MKEPYNWWTDPKNKEEVDRISWWEHPENKTTIEIPVSIYQEEDGACSIATNSDTERLIGRGLSSISAYGENRERAAKMFFEMMTMNHEYADECRVKYQKWVPLRVGPWSKGGQWFSFFGMHFNFRYGKGMKGGFYIPFTLLNISFSNEWKTYKRWKKNISSLK